MFQNELCTCTSEKTHYDTKNASITEHFPNQLSYRFCFQSVPLVFEAQPSGLHVAIHSITISGISND